MEFKNVKIEIFIPETHLDVLREALNKGGAGVIGNYDSCMSLTKVEGYWRPLEGSDPYEGEVGKLCKGSEIKVEVRCEIDKLNNTVNEIIKAHPYEEPVINVIPLIN